VAKLGDGSLALSAHAVRLAAATSAAIKRGGNLSSTERGTIGSSFIVILN